MPALDGTGPDGNRPSGRRGCRRMGRNVGMGLGRCNRGEFGRGVMSVDDEILLIQEQIANLQTRLDEVNKRRKDSAI